MAQPPRDRQARTRASTPDQQLTHSRVQGSGIYAAPHQGCVTVLQPRGKAVFGRLPVVGCDHDGPGQGSEVDTRAMLGIEITREESLP
nr:hypothetical protein [Hymenobacter crusticola]